jgi:Reverse transcriptase (RNA-dependent DNA polymerase)
LNDAFMKGYQVDVIFTDFSKAFDTVNHTILTDILRSFGICNPLSAWLSSYFSNRSLIVKYKNYFSSIFPQISGVPQRSHLAPILFLIYINDISFLFSKMLLFADDLKIFRIVKSLDDAALLQSDLNALVKWCDRNALSLNVQKCKFMSFNRSRSNISFSYNINNISLEKVFNCKDLGVFFDSKLTYNTHINYIKNKSLKLFGFIKFSCSNFNNLNALRVIYCSIIRSTLEYCSIIWSNNLQKHHLTLEAIQNKFLGFLCYRCNIPRIPHTSYGPILTFFSLDSLELRRIKLDLYFLYNILHNNIDCPEFLNRLSFLVPQRSTRSRASFCSYSTHQLRNE